MLYEHLDGLRERTSERLAQTLRQTGGTPQARTERDVLVAMYTQRLAQLDASENGLCFGRIDSDGGEQHYIGRLGIRDEDADYRPLLLDWRAPAARRDLGADGHHRGGRHGGACRRRRRAPPRRKLRGRAGLRQPGPRRSR